MFEESELSGAKIDELNEEADIAADYIEDLLDILDYDGDIEMGIRNGRPVVDIVADDDTDIKRLIGRDGDVAEALQHLARLAVQEKTGEKSRLILDVDGYLERKRSRLRTMVLDAIDDVRESGEPVMLGDMNSYERKIVHDVVREEGLKSRSHGEEPHRRVTIYLPKAGHAAGQRDDEPDEDGPFEEVFDDRDGLDEAIEFEDRRNARDNDDSEERGIDEDNVAEDIDDEEMDEADVEDDGGLSDFDDDIDEDADDDARHAGDEEE